jgi:Skp family chaperone for outer membrane proteins
MLSKPARFCFYIVGCTIFSLSAQDKKIGTIDVSVVDLVVPIGESEASKPEQQRLEKLRDEVTKKLEIKRQEVLTALNEHNAQKATLSPEAREKGEKSLMQRNADLQEMVKNEQNVFQAEVQKSSQLLTDQATEAAIQVAKAANVDVLLEKNTGRVLYTRNGNDLTDQVLKKMNYNYTVAQNKNTQPPIKTAAGNNSSELKTSELSKKV